MKIIILTSILLLIVLFSNSQTVEIAEPEWDGEILYANPNTNIGESLERQEASLNAKANASLYITGTGKVKATYSVRGVKSTTQIKLNNNVAQFVYRAKDNSINPKDVIEILEFVAKGDNRIMLVGSLGTFSGSSQGGFKTVDFKAAKYGKSSYLITITGVEDGEYGFSLGKEDSRVFYLFSLYSDGTIGSTSSKTIFKEFFEVVQTDKIIKGKKISIKSHKLSNNFDVDIEREITNNGLLIEKNEQEKADYTLYYFVGYFPKHGKDTWCFQVQVSNNISDSVIAKYSYSYKLFDDKNQTTSDQIVFFINKLCSF